MNLALYGYTDKRVIIMALFKILQTTGEILLVSDDRHYIRYTEDKTNYGYFHNATILVTDQSPDQIALIEDLEMERYRHVIYDLRSHIYEGSDVDIYVAPINLEESERNMMTNLRNVRPIYIAYSGMKTQGDLLMKKVSKKQEEKEEKGEEFDEEEETPEELAEDEDMLVIAEFPESLRMKKGFNVMKMTHALICQLELAESTRTCPVFSDAQLAKVIHSVIGDDLGCDVKLINNILKEVL